MKSAFLTPVFLAVSVFLSTQKITAFAAPTTFDGTWAARISADEYRNPDGTVALGWVIHIPAKIKNGQLYAEYGPRGADGSFVLHGKIAANGKAILHMTGTTGDPGKTVTHPHPGKPYDYEVIAHFDEQHGTGKSIDQIRRGIGRDKFFTFVRDPGPDLYRRVADLLVSQGNVAEGEQVLQLLKRKEYNDFFPGKVKDPVADVAPQHAYDQKWQDRFNAIHDQLAAIGREYSILVKKDPRTDEENQRLSVLQSALATAQQALEQLYRDIAMIGSPERVGGKRVCH